MKNTIDARGSWGDGQPWYVPLPMIDLQPRVTESSDGQTEALTTFGLGFDRLVEDCRAAETMIAQARSLLALAANPLGRNYELSLPQLQTLLRYFPEEPEGNEALWSIFRIATGDGPRTFARWCRLGAILSGANPDGLSLQDASDLAQIQVALGRLIRADRWVETLRSERELQSLDSLGAC